MGSLTDQDKEWINNRLEQTETKLLTAFYDWAKTYETRARGMAAKTAELEERLGIVEERLAKLERARPAN